MTPTERLDPASYDGLLTTRAMRRFTDEPVPDEVVRSILRAAVQAPSGGNIEPYQLLAVTGQATRDRRTRSTRCAGTPTGTRWRPCCPWGTPPAGGVWRPVGAPNR